MFNPCFTYNHELVNKLLEINSIRDFIVNAPVVLEMELSLKKDALLKSAHHSTAIEGNPLSLNQVDKLSKGIKIQGQKRAMQEVLNYLNVLKSMDSYIEDGKITKKCVLKLHENITHYTLEYTYLEGQYRSEPVYVVNQEGDVVFTPPNANLVQGQMEDLLEWINNSSGKLNAVISAGIIHYEFVRIHPFVDGNGRTSRALAAIYLYLRGFDVDFTLDEYYNSNRQAYYHALNSVDQKTQDLTDWLLYFLEGFLISLREIKDRIMLFPSGAPQKIRLTEKMLKILEYLQLNGSITNSEVQKLLNISRQGAYKDLRSLMDKGIIEKKGGSRSTYYILK
ncbi:Fic family protein [Methanobacterium formicicum]|uniref:Filamentation induced by cAMP protein fic n=1 Tax=Methanobacterium formicicum (strain DSM 3637 / PP1) TaxID=1204725 RepID=K2RUV1_METFP|nr:Fic family protein [Methanobacterium formicicum]EKF86560.1 filamentation induced by cAMP protein fic [Methanobacterium formicicum DSM 3637]